jgi:peptidoglycan/LPS O-acetylase OafA/YrhL
VSKATERIGTTTMRSFADYSSGRDNNFNALRLVAATMVLVSHSYALSTGHREVEPLRSLLGLTLGEIAVDVFFVASGFLVAGSLLVRQDLVEFFAARALRIFPGLWTALTVTVLVVGLWFTRMDLVSFFQNPETWRHWAKNALLFKGISYELPGAFETAPFAGAVNGSLWTLPKEVLMYLLLGGGWLLLRLLVTNPVAWLRTLCIATALGAVAVDLGMFLSHQPAHAMLFVGLLAKFFMGAALRMLQERIPASTWLFAILLGLACLSAVAGPMVFGVVYRIVVAYLVIYLALVPAGWVRAFNRIGDYSYGIYIYAFPVQQGIATLWHGITPMPMFATSFVVTFAFAFASWHLVEERTLKLKSAFRRDRSGSRKKIPLQA